MSDETPKPPEEEAIPEEEGEEDDAMRALLKRSLEVKPDKEPQKPLLAEVQRKIRQRSKGKFYNDGWSTTGTRVNYALIAVLMLLVVALAYFALGPVGLTAH